VTGPRPADAPLTAQPETDDRAGGLEHDDQARWGTAFGALAFLLWGSFPLYFRALEPASAIEILLHRVVWALLVCLLALVIGRRLGLLRDVFRSGRLVGALAVAAVLIAINWGVYIAAVNTGHVVEAALGYFINPLVTVLVGVLVLHERLRRLQWTAVAIGAVAVVVLTVDYGRPPWIALVLAASFASYGLVKKQVGPRVTALASLTTETMVLAPMALVALVWLELSGRGTFTADAPWHGVLLASTGIATTVPLVLFAAGSRRVPLSTMGLLQFITPVLQLLAGVLLLDEHVPGARWAGFGLVWVALTLLSIDSVRESRARTRARARARMCDEEFGPQNV
jgi:chloramphenicol-sensitive protein RarD